MIKIYCKDCKYYLGEVRFPTDHPMRPATGWDYRCGITNQSVFRINTKNNCLSFKPIKGLWKKFLRKLHIYG